MAGSVFLVVGLLIFIIGYLFVMADFDTWGKSGLANSIALGGGQPNGKKDGLQLIPISEVAAKDEFIGIKNVTRDDVLAAHRVPPQLLGIIPQNSGGFGDIGKAKEGSMKINVRDVLKDIAVGIATSTAMLALIYFIFHGDMWKEEFLTTNNAMIIIGLTITIVVGRIGKNRKQQDENKDGNVLK